LSHAEASSLSPAVQQGLMSGEAESLGKPVASPHCPSWQAGHCGKMSAEPVPEAHLLSLLPLWHARLQRGLSHAAAFG